MTNPDGKAGETPPSDPGSPPSEPLSSGYEAPPIEHAQDLPDTGLAQPSYEPYPPALDYPADIPYDYPPPPGLPPSLPGASSYPPPLPGYPPPPGYPAPGGYPIGGSGYPGYPGGYGMPPANPTNGMAIGSLVAAILGLFMIFTCGIGLLPALIGIGLGIVALNQIKQSAQPGFGLPGGQSGFGPPAEQPGRGLAIAGVALGAVGTLINGAWLLFFIGAALSSN